MRALRLYTVVMLLFNWGEGCVEDERRALLQIRDSVNYPNGSALSDWVSDDCCEWYGVSCNRSTSRVVSLQLLYTREESLGIWYPNATLFAQVKDLQQLDLSWNLIRGWVEPHRFLDLKELRVLALYDNLLTDDSVTPWIYNLSSLTHIDLASNRLKDSSTLTGFCRLKYLRELDLRVNSIEGSIPPCLGTMHSLEELYLSSNFFNGNMHPSIFSNLTSLEIIRLENNQFESGFSFSMFANLSKLQFIDLSNNHQLEVETESPSWVPLFQLNYLDLSNCIVNKHGGGRIPSFISTQYIITSIGLSHSSLRGSIPPWLLNNITLSLRLRDNMLSGPFPRPYQNSTELHVFDLSDNHIYGQLPENINLLHPNLNYLNMSTNALQGSISSSFGELTRLVVLDLSHNNFSGEIPRSLMRNNTSLQYLSLSNNSLSGEMLPGDSNMTQLKVLELHTNLFTRAISASLSNSPSLQILDIRRNNLSGNISSWLPVFPKMVSLLLAWNDFEGRVPMQLCQMQNLHMLDLSHNHLSGTIPGCLNNVTSWKKESLAIIYIVRAANFTCEIRISSDFTTKGRLYSYEGDPLSLMTGIDFSMNRLSGRVPSELGDLRELHSLNLSNNYLTGPFPSSFQKLHKLESLDISHNKLVGTIPPPIIQLHSLSTFSVAYKNLSGLVPFQSQFSTFNESSYEGNPGLCGELLKRNCSSYSPSGPDDQEEDESEIMENPLIYYSFIAASYAIGFWSVIAILVFNKNLRLKFFKVADRYIDACKEMIL